MDDKTQRIIEVAADLRGKLTEQGAAEVQLHKTQEFKRWASAYGDTERLKQEFNQLLGQARPIAATPSALISAEPPPRVGNGTAKKIGSSSRGVAQQLLFTLKKSPSQDFSAKALADLLSAKLKTVEGNLHRFAAEKKIYRSSPGHFRASKSA